MRPLLGLALLAASLLPAQQGAWYQMKTLAGAGGIGDGGPASAALFLNLTGVAVDPSGNLFVSDTDTHRVRRIAPNGIVTTYAGTGKPGSAGDGGPASQAQLNFPYGVATDYGGNLYIADLGNARIRKVTPDGRIATVAGHTPETRLIAPRNVAVDGPGSVYVSDFGAHRVYRLSASAALVPIAGTGKAGDAGDGGPATAALLNSPAGLAFDPAGNLYVGDTGNKRVRRILLPAATKIIESLPAAQLGLPVVATGLAHTFAGELWVPDGNGGTLMKVAPQQAAYAFPFAAMDVSADFAGNVYAVRGNLIRRIAARNAGVTLVGGGTPYYFSGDNGPAYDARLQRPGGVAVDPASRAVYIADSGNGRIRRISENGTIETVLDGFSNPQGLAWDARRNALFIADPGANCVWIWRAGTVAQSVFAGATGKAGFAGDNGSAVDAQLNRPAAVAVDDAGNVWISDTGNDRIRIVLAATGTILTAATQVKAPAGIAWNSRGFLYAAEPSTGRVHRIPAPGLSTATAPADFIEKPGSWVQPAALAIDLDGDSLLVADTALHRISRLASDGSVTVLAGTGEAGFDGDLPGPAVASRLETPAALVADYSRLRLLIADCGNHRIRSLEFGEDAVGNLQLPPPSATPAVSLANAANRMTVTSVVPGGTYILSAPSIAPGPGVGLAFDGIAPVRVPAPAPNPGNEWWIQVPPDLAAGQRSTEFTITRDGVVEVRQLLQVVNAAPGLYPEIRHADDGSVNSPANPVTRGQTILLRITGEGRDAAISVRIRDTEAAIVAMTPDVDGIGGTTQLEVRIPGGYFPSGAFPLTVSAGGVNATPGATVHVR